MRCFVRVFEKSGCPLQSELLGACARLVATARSWVSCAHGTRVHYAFGPERSRRDGTRVLSPQFPERFKDGNDAQELVTALKHSSTMSMSQSNWIAARAGVGNVLNGYLCRVSTGCAWMRG
jgi:hypothetical protein